MASSSSSSFSLFICIVSLVAAFSAAHPSTPIIPSSYTDYCSSIVPVSKPSHPITIHDFHSHLPYLNLTTTYFTGGHQLLLWNNQTHTFYYGQNSIHLQHLPITHQTNSPGVYMIQAILRIRSPYIADFSDALNNFTYGGTYSPRRRYRQSVRFLLTGFWSETSRKACMVGSAFPIFSEGRTLNFSGVLKLKYVNEKSNATIRSSIFSGSLESLSSKTDPGYFDPISIFSFPVLPHYTYSLLSEEISNLSSWGVAKSSLRLDATQFCSQLSYWRSKFLKMEYSGDCTEPEHCSPLGNSVLPAHLYLMPIQCSMDEKMIRYVARFTNATIRIGGGFSIESSLIAEGVWDDETNQLLVGACRMLNPIDHFDDTVGECGVRLSLRYPSILTIRNDSRVVGELWSEVSGKDKGYFPKIELSSYDRNDQGIIPGQTHEYTEMSRVRKSCPVKNTTGEGKTYPDAQSGDMKFDAIVQNSEGEDLAWGYATPVFVEEELYMYQRTFIASANTSEVAVPIISETKIGAKLSVLNISYKLSIQPIWSESNFSKGISSLNMSLSDRHQVEISAEGVYNVETGQLCMVGCRKSWNLANISMDCEILVKFEFPPLNARKGDRIQGTIVSTRREEDPLYFKNLTMSAVAFYTEMAEKSLWRMDLEITLVLISNTLLCIFVASQIFHVKRNPQVVSSISLMMVLILTLGHMIPLILNIKPVFSENHNKQTMLVGGGGWLEANEVAVRMITIVAFLLQIRLLQLVWTAKQHEGLDKGPWSPWSSEKKASVVTLSLYILGALSTLACHWIAELYDHHSVWRALRSYACAIVDGFLLPQIILNATGGSTEKALSTPFYMGTSAIRLLPHVYNLYRLQNFPQGSNVSGMYYYADEEYSGVWDMVTPVFVVPMALHLFLQQSCL